MIMIEWLLDWTWRSSILLGISGLLMAVLRIRSAAVKHALWTTTILGCLALPVFQLSLPRWDIFPQITAFEVDVLEPRMIEAVSSSTIETIGETTQAQPTNKGKQPLWTWALVISGALVSLFLAARVLRGQRKLTGLIRHSRPAPESIGAQLTSITKRQINARLTTRSTTPFVHGIFRPIILLADEAQDWPEDRMEAVLAHEVAHIERWDLLWLWSGSVLRMLQWWNPFVHIATKRLQEESERACDDAVLRRGMPAAIYATHLLDIASRIEVSTPALAPTMARGLPIESRLKRVLDIEQPRRPLSVIMSICLMSVILPLVMLLAVAGKASAQETKKGDDKHRIAVVLDAGHGGLDNGMQIERGAFKGYWEKDVALALTRKVYETLEERGIPAVLTHESEDPKGIVRLQERVDFANQYPKAVFLSIHLHDRADGKAKTFFTTKKDPNAPTIALRDALSKEFQKTLPKQDLHLAEADFKVLKSDRPSVMFTAIPPDGANTPQRQQESLTQLAEVLANGLQAWQKSKDQPQALVKPDNAAVAFSLENLEFTGDLFTLDKESAIMRIENVRISLPKPVDMFAKAGRAKIDTAARKIWLMEFPEIRAPRRIIRATSEKTVFEVDFDFAHWEIRGSTETKVWK